MDGQDVQDEGLNVQVLLRGVNTVTFFPRVLWDLCGSFS